MNEIANGDQAIVFLDFDGVLHPDCVFRNRVTNEPELQSPVEEEHLFMFAPLLVDLLKPYPHAKIILSTSWVPVYGLEKALSCLPEELISKVIGATWDEHNHLPAQKFVSRFRRYEQILLEAQRRKLNDRRWIAIDDDGRGWPEVHAENLIECNSQFGLSEDRIQKELHVKLSRMRMST